MDAAALIRPPTRTWKQFFEDLIAVCRAEVMDLAAAGCRYLQFDDTNLAYLCDPRLRENVTRSGDRPRSLGLMQSASPDHFGARFTSSIRSRSSLESPYRFYAYSDTLTPKKHLRRQPGVSSFAETTLSKKYNFKLSSSLTLRSGSRECKAPKLSKKLRKIHEKGRE